MSQGISAFLPESPRRSPRFHLPKCFARSKSPIVVNKCRSCEDSHLGGASGCVGEKMQPGDREGPALHL